MTSNTIDAGADNFFDDHAPRLRWMMLGIYALMVILFAWAAWYQQQDDAYIFYTYAQNIVNGNGYVFNSGERINATTSPLYTIILSVVGFVFQNNTTSALPIIGFTLSALGLWMIGTIGMQLLSDRGLYYAAYSFPFLIIIGAPYLLVAALGMETFITLTLIVATIYAYQTNRFAWVGIFSGLAVLSRPDALILSTLIFLDFIIIKRRIPPLYAIGFFLLVLAPWLIFSQWYFAALLPTTLSVKLGQTQSGFLGDGLIFLIGWLEIFILNIGYFAIVFVLLVLSFIKIERAWFAIKFVRIIIAWTLCYFIAYSILNPPDYHWYYTPAIIIVALLLALFLQAILQSIPAYPLHKLLITFVGFVVMFGGILYSNLQKPIEAKYVAYAETADWLNANVPDGSSVAANEIGILGFYYDNGTIIDGLGLVTPEVAEHVAQRDFDWYIDAYAPDYLVFNYPNRPVLEDMVNEAWFQEQYRLIHIIETPAKDVAIYQRH